MTNEVLVERIQSGERELLLELWEQVEKFVAGQARRRVSLSDGLGGVTFEDLYQSGYIALVAAADSFVPEEGRSFVGWLSLALKNAFAEAAGYRSAKQARDPLHIAGSLDAPIGEEDGGTLAELLPDPTAERALNEIENRDALARLHAALEAALTELTEEQRQAVYDRYWLGKPGDAKAHAAALKVLRHPSISKQLRQFVEERTPYCWHSGERPTERIIVRRETLALRWIETRWT